MSDSIRIGETGLNPTMAACPVCGEPNGLIVLTGLEGEKWAKRNGYPDGRMPRTIPVTFDPCEDCKKKGVTFYEIKDSACEGGATLKDWTGRLWMLKEEAIERWKKEDIVDKEYADTILKERYTLISESLALRMGFRGPEQG